MYHLELDVYSFGGHRKITVNKLCEADTVINTVLQGGSDSLKCTMM